jgi:hypothetical protein
MRLTVGPLPPSVYWRRRAVVLGVLALITVGIVYAVNGPDAGADPRNATGSQEPTTPAPTVTPTPTAFTLPVATVTGVPTQTGTQVAGTACLDSEIQLTASASPQPIRVNDRATFTLRIKNISNRTCVRNTGSIPQELRLLRGDEIVWSSDDCTSGSAYNYDQTFTPGFEKVFTITWDGYASRGVPCGTTRPAGGDYHLIARLGTLYSERVPVTIRSGS